MDKIIDNKDCTYGNYCKEKCYKSIEDKIKKVSDKCENYVYVPDNSFDFQHLEISVLLLKK